MAGAEWNTKALDALLKRLERVERIEIRWGFFRDAKYGPDNGDHYVAQVAKWQELGTHKKDGSVHIPPRPFFGTNVERIKAENDPIGYRVRSAMIQALKPIVCGGRYYTNFASGLGNTLRETLQEEILDFSSPKNAEYTIHLKGFNDPLIDTGHMYDSVDYKIVRNKKKE